MMILIISSIILAVSLALMIIGLAVNRTKDNGLFISGVIGIVLSISLGFGFFGTVICVEERVEYHALDSVLRNRVALIASYGDIVLVTDKAIYYNADDDDLCIEIKKRFSSYGELIDCRKSIVFKEDAGYEEYKLSTECNVDLYKKYELSPEWKEVYDELRSRR